MAETIKCKMVILTGLPIERADMGRFVVDLETLKLHKDRFSVDYQHDDYLPLGYIENLRYEEGVGLIGEATLSATNENDKANEIIQRIAEQYPFEVSPTLDMDASDVYELAEGETKIVNGNEITGECSIYYNVQFRGVGVVLFGTDKNTSITKLNNNTLVTLSYGEKSMSKKTKKDVVEETTPTTAELEAEPTTETTAEVPEYITLLNSFLDAFGTEKGLEYFRSNMSMEEAEKADYAELKALRAKLAAEKEEEEGGEEGGGGEGGGGEGEGGGGEGDSADKDDEKEKLMAELKSLKAEVTKLRTVFGNRGEDNPVSTSTKLSAPTLDPIHAMAEKIKRDGIKKKA